MRRLPAGAVEAFHAAGLLAVAGGLAWATGRPLVFPSLGPSAYLLVAGPRRPTARELLGGHAIGLVAGLLAYHALVGDPSGAGAAITGPVPAASATGIRLAASGVCSVALTTFGMALADARHAPACATTLIVSLGLLPGLGDALVVAAGVVALYAASVVTGAAVRVAGTDSAAAER